MGCLRFALGGLRFGPVEGVGLGDSSLSAGPEIIVRLLAGNLILAVIATVVSYIAVYRLAVAYQTSQIGEIIDEVVDEVVDETFKR